MSFPSTGLYTCERSSDDTHAHTKASHDGSFKYVSLSNDGPASLYSNDSRILEESEVRNTDQKLPDSSAGHGKSSQKSRPKSTSAFYVNKNGFVQPVKSAKSSSNDKKTATQSKNDQKTNQLICTNLILEVRVLCSPDISVCSHLLFKLF